jgi:hypothetical protein
MCDCLLVPADLVAPESAQELGPVNILGLSHRLELSPYLGAGAEGYVFLPWRR